MMKQFKHICLAVSFLCINVYQIETTFWINEKAIRRGQ